MTTQIQRRRGTTAQHSTFTGAVGEVTVDTDKEVLVVHDGAQVGGYPQMRENGSNSALALGSAGTPSLKFTGDPNTGIYSPGADQVAISTGGSGRLFVDSSGRVGVGTANPTSALHIDVASGEPFRLRSQTAGSNYFTHVNHAGGDLAYVGAGGGAALNSGTTSDYAIRANQGALLFGTNGNNERLRITSAGLVGVGTSSPGSILHCNYATATDTYIRTTNSAGTNGFDFGVSSGGEAWVFNRNNSNMYLGTNSAQRVTITAGGNVGIGTTSPSELLHVSKDQNAITAIKVTNPNTGASAASYLSLESGTKNVAISAYNAGSSFQIQGFGGIVTQYQDFDTHIWRNNAGTERARIDSSGKLLVGTSSSITAVSFPAQVQSNAFYGYSSSLFSADNNGSNFYFLKSRNATTGSHTVVQANDLIGSINFAGSDGTVFANAASVAAVVDGTPGANDMPGRLVFSTTADGASSPTERMRITNGGVVSINDVSPNANYFLNVAYEPNSKGCVYLENFAFYTSQHALVINDIDTNNARTMSDVRFERNGTEVGFIKINPSSVTYSTTSDYRLKENVVPLLDATNRLKQLQVKRFNFISDPERTVDGFIAHEAQAVVPEAVSGVKDETKDLGNIVDTNGRIVATAVDEPLPEHLKDGHTWIKTHTIDVHQGIDQSKLVPLLTAALQEAVAKIESLEARLTAAGI